MTDYICVRLHLQPYSDDAADLLADGLAAVGYDTFEPQPMQAHLKAYIKAVQYDAEAVQSVIDDLCVPVEVTFDTEVIPGKDWNEEWERNYYQPIVIGDQIVVHSTFHHDVPQGRYDIVIDPKMAFGTGHHATTTQVLQRLLNMPLQGRSLIDMGTGTAILAILAAMRGASPVTGIEIDEDAYNNAGENIVLNNVQHIRLIHGDASALDTLEPADVFVANINRNVITTDISSYARALKPGGTMILSGFYPSDVELIEDYARPFGLRRTSVTELDGWACLTLSKLKVES